MSEKANPVLVGGFALGGLVIAIAGLLIFGGGKMFEKKFTCIAYFQESLSGLDIGAPVEYKGVRIGTVSDVRIIVDREKKMLVRPVTIILEPSRLSFKAGEKDRGFSLDGIENSIKDGLRAKLATQSMLTGKLKIELDMQPDTEAVFKAENSDILEIPTMLSPIEAMKEQFGQMHFSAVFADIHKITESISSIVEDEETKNLTKELNTTLRAVQELMVTADKQLLTVGNNVSAMALNANKLMSDLDSKVTPVSADIASIATSARLSMKNANKLMLEFAASMTPLMKETTVAVGRVSGALDERSTLRVELEDMIDSLAKAAKSFSELTSFIEQHPESLLRGKE